MTILKVLDFFFFKHVFKETIDHSDEIEVFETHINYDMFGNIGLNSVSGDKSQPIYQTDTKY